MTASASNFERDLIFDLGAAGGEDSAYYLHKGYRVIAVEPNPVSASLLRERFVADIERGRLSLVTAAVRDREGEAPFWVCDDVPGWSSFDRSIASYCESRHHCISVTTLPFSSLLERFGVPFYCKIDVEGSDSLCLGGMTAAAKPPFLSIELPTVGRAPVATETAVILEHLEQLGYERFKVISQVTYRQPGKLLPSAKARLPRRLSLRLTKLDGALRTYQPDRDWRFRGSSSGPFAEDTHGRWLGIGEARRLIAIIQRNRDISDWFDVHAAVAELG